MKTVKVIPYRKWVSPEGRSFSLFSSYVPEGSERVTKGYTWEIVSSRGTLTVGLGRVPAKTIEEANAVAADLVSKCGYTLI